MLPEYDENALKSETNWSEYEKHYEDQWKDGALMYNTSTGRMITPPAEEIPRAQTRSEGVNRNVRKITDFTPERLGREDEPLGVGNSRSATLEPKKPSIAGRKDAILADWAATNISDRGKGADARFDDSRMSRERQPMSERVKDGPGTRRTRSSDVHREPVNVKAMWWLIARAWIDLASIAGMQYLKRKSGQT